MTRINCVPPSELVREHLIAEYRELPRVYSLAKAALQRGEGPEDFSDQYHLGTGHVRFFYARLGFVMRRHRALIAEMQERDCNARWKEVPDCFEFPLSWRREWHPSNRDMALNRARINQRLKEMAL